MTHQEFDERSLKILDIVYAAGVQITELRYEGKPVGKITSDRFYEAKQAIKQLVADEMLELIGNDLQPLPNGYMPESHDNVNNRLAIQRAKLAEWRRSR